MVMEARLQLRPLQKLVMTPMLQQAIHLLQLSTIELQEAVQKELMENPLLEEVPAEETPAAGTAGEAAATEAPAPEPPVPEGASPPDLPFEIEDRIFGPPDERSLVQQEEHDETRFENFISNPTTLTDHLTEQIRLTAAEPPIRAAAEEIIGNLDEDGYLRATLEEMAERSGLPVKVFEDALHLVHGFDPPGVGARDLRECLLIQLRTHEAPDPVAIEIVSAHFEAFQRCRYAEIARALRLDPERVVAAVTQVARLEPKPGRPFDSRRTEYLGVDVVVEKHGDEYVVIVDDDNVPRLRISSLYRSMILRGQTDDARKYLDEKHRLGLWFIKSIEQRRRTLFKVTSSIVRFQREFLDKGIAYLRPLALRDVADDIQMHESTVSRVTTKKNVQTPQGLFPLKFFFHSGISQDHGDEVSSLSVKKMIEDLVAQEAVGKPLSDQDITRLLKQRGLNIARRTVAKYREEVGILPSHQRRLAIRRRG